jgi:hypothetical protein
MSDTLSYCALCDSLVDNPARHYMQLHFKLKDGRRDYQPRMAQLAAAGKLPTEKQARDLDYQTPEYVLECVRAYFGGPIPLDPATCPSNPTKATTFLTEKENGLERPWDQNWFVNPPYGKEMRQWIEKIGAEAHQCYGVSTTRCEPHGLALLPVNRTETQYWQDCIGSKASAVVFVRKRIAFIRPSTGEKAQGNPYSSAIWGFNTDWDRFKESFKPLGLVVRLEH